MTDTTPRLGAPLLAAAQAQKHVTHNDALYQFDAMIDLCLLGQFVNTPPSSPADGDAYLIGGTPAGAWSGHAYKIACCADGAWRFYTPFNGLRAYVVPAATFIVHLDGVWTDWNALISAAETAVASAATCDLGAAGALFVEVTGTTAITSFGTAANRLRFVRFAGALTLTHNATSLALLGGASRVTAAGDTGLYTSDASGNWRERDYRRADGSDAGAGGGGAFFYAGLNGSDQTLTSTAVTTQVNAAHASIDNKGWFDTANHRYTPQAAGYYAFMGAVAVSASATMTGGPQAYLFKNGSLLFSGQYVNANQTTGSSSAVFGLLYMNGTTDYVDLRCYVPANATAFRGSETQTYLTGYKVG
jgi:hypothetical protein